MIKKKSKGLTKKKKEDKRKGKTKKKKRKNKKTEYKPNTKNKKDMITYNWNCKTVDVHPQEEGETDVVYNVHWIVTGISDQLDPEGNPYSATNIGTQIVPLNPETPFVPFEDLTNEIVVGWTQDAMGEEQVTAIETNISSSIELLINPVSITLTIGEPIPPTD